MIGRPPREPVPDTRPGPEQPRRYVVPGLRGHTRLVAGMVYANRPWRLFGSLSRGLAGVFATATVLFINSATWNLATALGAVQHAVITAVSAVALSLWIIVDHQPWERGAHLPARHHPLYPYNLVTLVTLVTVALAVVVLATALFATRCCTTSPGAASSGISSPGAARPGSRSWPTPRSSRGGS
nr:hypothetical protein [Streptomyces sp. TP-A0356]